MEQFYSFIPGKCQMFWIPALKSIKKMVSLGFSHTISVGQSAQQKYIKAQKNLPMFHTVSLNINV